MDFEGHLSPNHILIRHCPCGYHDILNYAFMELARGYPGLRSECKHCGRVEEDMVTDWYIKIRECWCCGWDRSSSLDNRQFFISCPDCNIGWETGCAKLYMYFYKEGKYRPELSSPKVNMEGIVRKWKWENRKLGPPVADRSG